MTDGSIELIDQRKLPDELEIIRAHTLKEQAEAISTLAVRGAPAIGVFGALALALSIKRGEDEKESYRCLISTRPTAVDLKNCMDIVMEEFGSNGADAAYRRAEDLMDRTVSSCRMIGEKGSSLISNDTRVMTHCNAGALATIDWGTALAPIRMAAWKGSIPFVWVSETRPLLQGSRLTAWELLNEGIPHSIIVDDAAAHLMSIGEVDMVIVGADRIAFNGDIANKIGTLEKALAAREFGIPFYVAAPSTTLDVECRSGRDIVIEERAREEVLELREMSIAPEGSGAYNPAFDVTPHYLINGYITERGILFRDELFN